MTRTTYAMSAFILGWCKNWQDYKGTELVLEELIFKNPFNCPDLFSFVIINLTDSRVRRHHNEEIARRFGEIVTQVKAFPTDRGWIILDKHTKRLLHKEVKNENEVEALCKKNGYLR